MSKPKFHCKSEAQKKAIRVSYAKRARNEFRFNFNHKHKQYVFEETEKDFKSLGITHNESTFGVKNMPLEKNPQKDKTEKSYIRNGVIVDEKSAYGRVLKNYEFSDNDFASVKSKIRNYKKNKKKGRKKEPRS